MKIFNPEKDIESRLSSEKKPVGTYVFASTTITSVKLSFEGSRMMKVQNWTEVARGLSSRYEVKIEKFINQHYKYFFKAWKGSKTFGQNI